MAAVNKWMIDPKDAVMLLIDHQSGLFQLVKDIDLPVLRSNVIALAKVSRLAQIPTFTTASVPDGPNGPLIPEIHQYNPDAVYIARTGQINAWDNPAWVEAIETDRKFDSAGGGGAGPGAVAARAARGARCCRQRRGGSSDSRGAAAGSGAAAATRAGGAPGVGRSAG